jgi:hypothetical protein
MVHGHFRKRTHRKSQKIRLAAQNNSVKAEMLFHSKAWAGRVGVSENFPDKFWAKACRKLAAIE